MELSRRAFVATTVSGFAALAARPSAQGRAPEDGYKLWLRYAPPGEVAGQYRDALRQIVVQGKSSTARVTREELTSALSAMLGSTIPVAAKSDQPGALVVGTPATSPIVKALGWQADLTKLGPEGYIIRTTTIAKRPAIAIASQGDVGALYGAFHFLRLIQTAKPIAQLDIQERPRVQLRMLNHWDNMNGTIERGYAGRSLWQWADLPGTDRPAIPRLRARQRLDWHQRRRPQQRQRRRPRADAGIPRRRSRRSQTSGVPTASACTSRPTSPLPSASAA